MTALTMIADVTDTHVQACKDALKRTDLAVRATAAVAAIPANLIGSPTAHAVRAIRVSYLRDGIKVPPFSDLLDAVDDAFNAAAHPPVNA